MTTEESETLIKKGFSEKKQSIWADLGCGSGIFSYALAGLLKSGSKIYAIDKATQSINSQVHGVEVLFVKSDFEKEVFPFENIDGILMANSLHYIKDQTQFIKKLKNGLDANGRIILVEYDTEKSNRWVPFPVSFNKATKIFIEGGFESITRIGERQSVYRADKIYSCLIT